MTATLQELMAQQADIAAQLLEYERPLIADAKAVLTEEAVLDLIATLTAIRDQLPESLAKTHIGNVLIVLTAAPQILAQEMTRVGGNPVIPPLFTEMP